MIVVIPVDVHRPLRCKLLFLRRGPSRTLHGLTLLA